jgi:hypothetical protein
MPCTVNIQIGGRGWGVWKLEESSEALYRSGAVRTGDGFMLPIPGSAYSGLTWAPIPAGPGQGFRNDAGAESGGTWALVPA